MCCVCLLCVQVILVGDFNIASEKRDVHDAISWDSLYHPSELKALHDITGPQGCNCTDTWRHMHPDTEGVYTVWEERTSARAFNVVRRALFMGESCGNKYGQPANVPCRRLVDCAVTTVHVGPERL